jgi:hypothetical protein
MVIVCWTELRNICLVIQIYCNCRATPTIDAGTYQYYYGDAGNGAISSSVTATSVVTDDSGVTSRADSGFTGLEDNEPVIPVANSTIGYDSEL